jgi:hypothetical protein
VWGIPDTRVTIASDGTDIPGIGCSSEFSYYHVSKSSHIKPDTKVSADGLDLTGLAKETYPGNETMRRNR